MGEVSTRPGMGATVYQDNDDWGTTFRTWAPHADAVYLTGSFNNWATNTHPLSPEDGDLWSLDVSGVWAGHEYQFIILNDGNTYWRNDPRARKLTSSNGKSIIADPDEYVWEHSFSMPNWNEMVIYEMHPGTFGVTDGGGFPGTFDGVLAHLDYLANIGINTLEFMPINEFAGDQSWGYNPGHIFSVESYYGGPEKFKRLVDACHERGIAVMLDVVFNHLGPSDLGAWQFDGWTENDLGGIYFYNDDRAHTPWGSTRPNFGEEAVRQWMQDAVMQSFDEYHIDGIRMDGTRWIEWTDEGNNPDGWSWMQWVNDELNTLYPEKLIVAEDMSNNHWITRPTSSGGAGFDAQWDPWFVHPVREVVETSDDEYRNMWAIKDAITFAYNDTPFQRVIYTESHDEVANGRSRVPEAIWPGNAESYYSKKRSTLAAGVMFTSPGIPMIFQGQEFLEDEWFTDAEPLDWSRAETFSGITDLYRDLIAARLNKNGNTRGLTGEHVNVHHINDGDKVVGWHRWRDGGVGDDVIILANFRNQDWDDYRIGFPTGGTWKVRFNSDWTGYDPEFGDHLMGDILVENTPRDGLPFSASLQFGAYSMVILSQSPPCLNDLDGNGAVSVDDLLIVIASWGTPDADVTGDGVTNVDDLLSVIASFGQCL
ncbi:MAG: 1,4-alpha-glucan branching protein [Planctomycetes bacterium]|nr:1,4-alpha-glucan branching protein [Planctomycetota bacterium]MCP4838989.1 1,4-alpha-glucan branching protein [Planctomycetota bacterium]